MPKPPRPPRTLRRGPGSLILPILLTLLVLSTVLAYQVQDTARSHQRARERALRDYAAFATWELVRGTEDALARRLTLAVSAGSPFAMEPRLPRPRVSGGPGRADGPGGALRSYPAAVRESLGWCACPEAVHHFFRMDLRGGELQLLSGPASTAFRDWLARALTAPALPPPAGRPMPLIQQEILLTRGAAANRSVVRVEVPPIATGVVEGRRVSVAYAVEHEDGRPARAYGFAFDPAKLAAPVLRGVVARMPLLPPSLTGDAPNAAVLSVAALSAAGDTVFRTPGGAGGSPVVVDTLGNGFSEIVTRVAVRPEVAGRLVIGGLPRSRLPLLLGVFALTLGLVAVALVQLRRQQELVRLRSEFVSGVSHELRTPLAQIRLFADLLDSDRLGEAQRRKSVRIINEEAQRLTYLVENVLRFSRSERRADRIAPVPVELAPLVREIVDSFAPLARAREVELRTELQEGICAPADPDALRQVLLNLLDNAAKYGPRGGRITVGLEREGSVVRLRVDDQGPGIAPGHRERVWEPYRRLERDVEAATGGSGIGLAVVRELVEMHGGSVAVEDAPGGGARFAVSLPHAAEAGAGTAAGTPRRVQEAAP
ncbi:MAG TPA: HAMP domain-containing sensor histidine kinase [Longimicrobiaceae bacterium]|nr:HAMP domain-containing sensor histidine kinase [Longimicrobiaceae bacterium]